MRSSPAIVTLVATITLIGCGGTDAATAEPTTTSTASSTTSAPPPKGTAEDLAACRTFADEATPVMRDTRALVGEEVTYGRFELTLHDWSIVVERSRPMVDSSQLRDLVDVLGDIVEAEDWANAGSVIIRDLPQAANEIVRWCRAAGEPIVLAA